MHGRPPGERRHRRGVRPYQGHRRRLCMSTDCAGDMLAQRQEEERRQDCKRVWLPAAKRAPDGRFRRH